MAGVYSSLGFALPLMDTSVCFQRSARGAQAVLPVELELNELKTELELELDFEVEFELDFELKLELDFELLMLLELIEAEEKEDIAIDDDVFEELLTI
jgi:hypothetical protein